MNNLLKGAVITSLVVIIYGLLFHGLNVTPNDWQLAVMWLSLYIAPIWGLAGMSWLSERSKNE